MQGVRDAHSTVEAGQCRQREGGGRQVALSREISAFAQEKEEQMQTKIDRIRELSEENRNRKFVSLFHLINERLLLE